MACKVLCPIANVLIPKSGSKKGRQIKLLAEINLDQPLFRGTKIHCQGQEVWVDFKYENITTFYFYYETVGYLEKNCIERKNDAKIRKLLEGQYGNWLRVDQG